MTEKIKITFLGTGAMIPDEKRSHPAFLLTYKAENILVDCGEGTQIQFRKAKLNPGKITRILITHWHGDHTFGLPGLLRTLETSGHKKTLFIYGPKGFKKHMDEMFAAFGRITEFEIKVREVFGKFFENSNFYLEAERMIHVQPCNAYSFVAKGNSRIDKRKLRKFKIKEGKHLADLKRKGYMTYNGKRYRSNDLTFRESGKKISFVLDTVINNNIDKITRGADLLICEATFGKGQERLAREYKHLTSIQAAEIARKAKVKKLYLTHISQRYEKNLGKILHEAKRFFRNSSIPKDLDVIYV